MNKTLVRIIALFVLPCLLTEQMTEPAFSEALAPWLWGSRGLSLNGWVANFNEARTAQALESCTPHLQELSIFGVAAHANGGLAPETDFIDLALAATRKLKSRPRVLLTVANIRPRHLQDRWLIQHWLGTPVRWNKHIWSLLQLAGPVDGLDIDYENLRREDGPRFSKFIAALGQALHARGKVLTVTVEHQLITEGDIDWKQVSDNVDRVRVMAYQYHYDRTEAGAVSPPDIVVDLAARALRVIPAAKLEIALPLYGFDWTQAGHGKLVSSMEQFKQLAHQPGAHAFRDPLTRSARINYVEMQGKGKHRKRVLHEVWFEDPASLVFKVHRLQRLGVGQIGLWQMAVGDLSGLFQLVDSHRSVPTL